MRLRDLTNLRKVCLTLSINLNSSYQSFADMELFDLFEVCKDYAELQKEMESRARRYR